jgi:hypothetical protein
MSLKSCGICFKSCNKSDSEVFGGEYCHKLCIWCGNVKMMNWIEGQGVIR